MRNLAAADPGFPVGGGGAPTSDASTLVEMYAKTKELDPIGGGGVGGASLDPPLNRNITFK